mmetsp:Transcript_90231/g.260160  ORF Transcript_90231/g.260160 Transcript_90231/m.260160 type:complete len:339 (+) Transcript_90231:154-1170(+)
MERPSGAAPQFSNSEPLPRLVSTPRSSRPPSAPRPASARCADDDDSETEGAGPVARGGAGAAPRSASCNSPRASAPRCLEEHRVDPALRAALEQLDAVRQKQPSMDDFTLERFIGGRRRQGAPPQPSQQRACSIDTAPQRGGSWRPSAPGSEAGDIGFPDEDGVELEAAVDAYLRDAVDPRLPAPSPVAPAAPAAPAAPGPRRRPRVSQERRELRGAPGCPSMDLLMAAVRAPPQHAASGARHSAPWLLDGSPSTSPGSTHLSSLSGSGGPPSARHNDLDVGAALAEMLAARQLGAAAPPQAPTGRAPRRPARQREHSARGRTADTAPADQVPHSARR